MFKKWQQCQKYYKLPEIIIETPSKLLLFIYLAIVYKTLRLSTSLVVVYGAIDIIMICCSTALTIQLKQFMVEHPDQGTASRTFTQMVEATQANIRWMDYHYDDVEKWLEGAI